MALTPGTRLGPYEVVAALGAGGMGEVYRARDARLKRGVAVKVLPGAVAGDAERVARFQREAELLATLNHPLIATLYGLEEFASPTGVATRALVMELVEGDTLAERVARGPLPVDDAIAIARQLIDALDYAHSRGVLHRDLKPANVKVTPDGRLKVLDFGLAKAFDTSGEGDASPRDQAGETRSPTVTSPAHATGFGMLLGTAAYMSPEQARGQPVDRRADIWAFGAVLYELLAGRRPFGGDTTSDTLAAVLTSDPDWTRVPASTPDNVRRLLRRCLTRDPKERLRDIADARHFIDDATPSGTTSPGAAPPRSVSSFVAWSVAMASSLVAIALMLWPKGASVPAAVPARPVYSAINPPDGALAAFDRGFALSPDGEHLAFTARDRQGLVLLWLRTMSTGQMAPVAGTRDAAFPFWSPDSRNVAFWSERRIKRVGTGNSTPQIVSDAPASSILFRGGAWLADDTIVFGDSDTTLRRVAAAGGAPVEVGLPGVSVRRVAWPRALPEPGAFFVGLMTDDPSTSGIYRVDLLPEPRARLLQQTTNTNETTGVLIGTNRVASVRAGALVSRSFDGVSLGAETPLVVAPAVGNTVGMTLVSASATGDRLILASGGDRTRTHWLARSGSPAEQPAIRTQATYRIAPDGVRALLTQANDLWIADVDRAVTTRVTTTSEPETAPVWSPDGLRIAYRVVGVPDLFIFDTLTSTTEHHEGTVPHTRFIGIDWSPDGRRIVASAAKRGMPSDLDLVLYDLSTRTLTSLTDTPFSEVHPRFSPDGVSVAYASDETGEREIYIRDMNSKVARRVSPRGGDFPMWRRDGKELVYLAPNGDFMSVALSGPSSSPGEPVHLFNAGPVRTVTDQPRFDMTPDGRRFLIDLEPPPAPLTLIEHWAPPQP